MSAKCPQTTVLVMMVLLRNGDFRERRNQFRPTIERNVWRSTQGSIGFRATHMRRSAWQSSGVAALPYTLCLMDLLGGGEICLCGEAVDLFLDELQFVGLPDQAGDLSAGLQVVEHLRMHVH